jgi:hypothetical protein
MKVVNRVAFVIVTMTALVLPHGKGGNPRPLMKMAEVNQKRCPANSDKLYERKAVLNKLAKTLNKSIPEYKEVSEFGYYVDDSDRAGGFFIYDLTDTSNQEILPSECINLINNHVYHVCPLNLTFSLSHILILEGGKLKIFKAVNCAGRGDSLESVIAYLEKKLIGNQNSTEVIKRVRNYRQYGSYFRFDSYSMPLCQKMRGD